MRVAIPIAEGKRVMHFIHCRQFALIDADERNKKIIKKEIVPAPSYQPGILPKWLHERETDLIITWGMSSRARSVYAQNNIRVVTGAPAEEPEKLVIDYLNDTLG